LQPETARAVRLLVSVDRLGGRKVRTRRATIIRRRFVAGAVVLAAAVSAPVAVAASTSHSSSRDVHTQVQKDGTVLVSGYDGGVALQAGR
jgi:hypothetical protein